MASGVELAQQEFRQVRRVVTAGEPLLYFTVQQKWLVQCGDPYTPEGFGPPDRPTDVFMHTDGQGFPVWMPMRVEWRELPTVDEKDL